MKIAYVIYDEGIDLDSNNGHTLHIFHIIKNLRKKKHKVKLIYSKCRSHFLFKNIKLAKKCKGSTVIHERYSLYSLVGFIASKIYKIPLILEMNSPLIEEREYYKNVKLNWFQKKIIRYTTRKTFEQAKFIGVVSKEIKNYLINEWRINQEKIFIVPNTVDSYKFSKKFDTKKIKQKYGVKQGYCVVMFIGTLRPWHGVQSLIKTFYKVCEKNKKTQLIIVGDYSYKTKPSIETQIEQLQLKDNVMMTGNIEHKKIPEILSIADITVLPYSKIDNFYFSPLKLFEYMAAEKAIVASDQGQINRVLKHNKTGVLVEPGNIKELSSAIIGLVKNKKKRLFLGRNAALKVKDNTWSDHVEKFLTFYEKCLKNDYLS